MRWDKLGLPHKGWKYIGMEDLGEDVYSGEEIEYERCEMCGKEKIRYVHILKHQDYEGEIRVGCVCASKLLDDYCTPREIERDLRNRTNRRNNFLRREWSYKSSTGNYTLRYKGENITIMKSKFGVGWGVIYDGSWIWEYHGRKIYDLHTAKKVAFDLFDELYDSRGQVQPYWEDDRWIYY